MIPRLSLAFILAFTTTLSVAFVARAQEVPSGSITIVERARCDTGSPFNGCGVNFFFETRGSGLADFSLAAARRDRDFNSEEFTALAAGIYRITQTDNDGWPLVSIFCTSDRRAGNFTYGGTYARIDLRDGEDVTCEFTNALPTPTPTPTATQTPLPTATPQPTSTPVPPTAVPATVSVGIQCVDGSVAFPPFGRCPVPPVATPITVVVAPPAVVVRPPNTGDGGLAAD